jgi:hypothetical protein
MMLSRHLCNFSVTLALIACGSDDAPTTGDSTGNVSGRDELVGTFRVELAPDTQATNILGKVATGPSPAALAWDEVAENGECLLLKPRVPFCDPACGSDVCVEDGVCQAHPESLSAGEVRVSGLLASDGAADFALIQVANAYQAPPSVPLAFPPFAAGDPITITAAGAAFNAFVLEGQGISPLVASVGALAIAAGAPLELEWEAATAGSGSVIHVELDISHHGGTKGMIQCEAADDGALTIDAELVDALVALGVAGFPTIILQRRATSSTSTAAGRVDLVVAAGAELAVTVPGLVSCTEDEECPDGTECQSDLTCN